MTLGEADDLVCEFAFLPHPGPPSSTSAKVPCESAWRLESCDLSSAMFAVAHGVCGSNPRMPFPQGHESLSLVPATEGLQHRSQPIY
jgi:hypothetical protein